MTNYAAALAAQFHLKEQQTAKLIELIDAGNTIPFIARYRKEEHGSLDDQTIRTVYERLQYRAILIRARWKCASLSRAREI